MKESTADWAVLSHAFWVKQITAVKSIHKQAFKTDIYIVFSVFSELFKSIIQPEASLWGKE